MKKKSFKIFFIIRLSVYNKTPVFVKVDKNRCFINTIDKKLLP